MNIYVGHSNDMDYVGELYLPLRGSVLSKEHNIVLPHENTKEPFNSKEFLTRCDLFIAEVSNKSTGLGIELGWASLMGVPIVCLHKEGVKVSNSLKVVSKEIIGYENKVELIRTIDKIVQSFSLNRKEDSK